MLENRNHHTTNLYGDLPEKLHSLHSSALPDAIGQGRGVISRVWESISAVTVNQIGIVIFIKEKNYLWEVLLLSLTLCVSLCHYRVEISYRSTTHLLFKPSVCQVKPIRRKLKGELSIRQSCSTQQIQVESHCYPIEYLQLWHPIQQVNSGNQWHPGRDWMANKNDFDWWCWKDEWKTAEKSGMGD